MSGIHLKPSKHFLGQDLEAKNLTKYSGFRNILTSVEFVCNLGTMYDALSELSDVSKQLQGMHITLPEAVVLLSRQVQISASKTDCLGVYAKRMAVPNKMCTIKALFCMTAKLLKSM